MTSRIRDLTSASTGGAGPHGDWALRTRVEQVMARCDAARTRRDLVAVAAFDRYQASHGLAGAAAHVRGAALEAEVPEVFVRTAPGDGVPAWWDWRAPQSWTPHVVRLRVTVEGKDLVRLDRVAPFALATHSAPATVEDAPVVTLDDALPGAVVVMPPGRVPTSELTRRLERESVAAILTSHARTSDARGRVELPLGAALCGFSLTAAEHRRVREAVARGRRVTARFEVTVHDDAPMTWVDARIPGALDGEVWVVAHLCHPAPSANDNAAGVAATLEVARLLVERLRGTPHHTVRFVWGPEYLATVATLHARTRRHGVRGVPLSILNVDMIGTDQDREPEPFVVEGSRLGTGGLVDPLAVGALAEAFRATAHAVGRWEATPFLGFSDHALVAGPSPVAPAVQFAHPHSRRTHSSADTEASVSDVEVLRATAAVTATVEALCAPRFRPGAAACHEDVRRWARVRTDARVHRRQVDIEARRLHDLVDRGSLGQRRFVPGCGPLNLREQVASAGAAVRHDVGVLSLQHRHALALLHETVLRVESGVPDRRAPADGEAAWADLPPAVVRRTREIADEIAFAREGADHRAEFTDGGDVRA